MAGIAREMALERTLAIPRLDGKLFLEYPPLGYWPLSLALRAGAAPGDLVALLPTAAAALGVVYLTFRMARRIAGTGAGLLAAVLLQSTLGFRDVFCRLLVDPLLCLTIALSLHGLLFAFCEPERRARHLLCFHGGMGLAFLTKGLVGIALPAAAALAFLSADRRLARLPGLVLHPSLLALLAPIALWLAALGREAGGPVLGEVLRESVVRALSPGAKHAGPAWYYLLRGPHLLLPGLLLLPFALRDAFAPGSWRRVRLEGLDRFGSAWFVAVFALLSLASAKRSLYLGPVYPGLAISIAIWWARARAQAPDAFPQRWLVRIERLGPRAWNTALAAMALASLVFQLAVEIPTSRARAPEPLFDDAAALAASEPDARVALAKSREAIRGAAVYYLGRLVPVVESPARLAELGAGGPVVLVGRTRELDALLASVPPSRRGPERAHWLGDDEYRVALLRPGAASVDSR